MLTKLEECGGEIIAMATTLFLMMREEPSGYIRKKWFGPVDTQVSLGISRYL
jgi:hypothetical protein